MNLHFILIVLKFSGSCNNINDPYAKMCVPDVVKNLIIVKMKQDIQNCMELVSVNVEQVFGITKTGWDKDKCRCECKELIECKDSCDNCDKGFMQNPSSCEYECGKSCDVGEYLDYENYKCRKILLGKLVEECSENVDGIEMISVNLNDQKNVYYSCTVYIVLFAVFLIIIINISGVFIFFIGT